MKKISSDWTTFNKRVFPRIWLGFLGLFCCLSVVDWVRQGLPMNDRLMFVFLPLVMMLFGWFFFKKFLFDLSDEVHDDGDSLLIRNG